MRTQTGPGTMTGGVASTPPDDSHKADLMSTARIDILDRSVEKGNGWVNDPADELGTKDHLLRSGMAPAMTSTTLAYVYAWRDRF